MAELSVQPKKKSPWWIWLLLALIVLALIFFFLSKNGDDEIEERDTYEPETGAVDTPSSALYVSNRYTAGNYALQTA